MFSVQCNDKTPLCELHQQQLGIKGLPGANSDSRKAHLTHHAAFAGPKKRCDCPAFTPNWQLYCKQGKRAK